MDAKSPADILKIEQELKKKRFSGPGKKETTPEVTRSKQSKPKPMEGNTPRSAESSKEAVDAKTKQGSERVLPIAPATSRPQPESKKTEEGSVIVAKHLAPQLATDPDFLSKGQWDERKLAVLDDGTLAAMSHFSHRYVYDGVRYWGHICEWWLTGSQGIGGRGRTDMLRAIGASAGVQSIERVKQPNVLARNLWNKDWKGKAAAQGKIPEGEG